MKKVPVKDFFVGDGKKLTVISGPCVIESMDHCLRAAEELKEIFSKLDVNFVFKSSFDKANRSSVDSFRGPGLHKGLEILQKVKEKLNLPIVTDIHLPEQVKATAEVVDILQIPALLCRQTDLLIKAGESGRVICIKKGQFISPWDMENVINKVLSTGNDKIISIERGTNFGYNNLVNDFRSIPIMQKFGFPVCFDATHSVQLPSGLGKTSGGQKEFIATLAKAAVAAGSDAVFLESHPKPDQALCDSTSVIDFKDLPSLISKLKELFEAVK